MSEPTGRPLGDDPTDDEPDGLLTLEEKDLLQELATRHAEDRGDEADPDAEEAEDLGLNDIEDDVELGIEPMDDLPAVVVDPAADLGPERDPDPAEDATNADLTQAVV